MAPSHHAVVTAVQHEIKKLGQNYFHDNYANFCLSFSHYFIVMVKKLFVCKWIEMFSSMPF